MKNYKNIFPFKIGTTSYILHTQKNNIIKNINYLKHSFNKIQLLLFGKNYLDDFLNPEVLNALRKTKKDSSIEYSIHLPIDLDLLNNSEKQLEDSINIIVKIIEKTKFLNIKNYILHIDNNKKLVKLNKSNFDLFKNVCKKIKNRISNTYLFNIENTAYDLTYFKEIIFEYGYSVCLDFGHLFNHNHDFDKFYSAFNKSINEIHVYGFMKEKDHLSLDKLDRNLLKIILNYLKKYNKSVIIEVFNKPNLKKSLNFLQKYL